MSTLYPSLEDLKVDQAMQGMQVPTAGPAGQSRCPEAKAMELQQVEKTKQLQTSPSVLYPNLAELESYMGLSFSSHEVQQNLPQIPEGASVGSGLGPLTGPGGGAGVREQHGSSGRIRGQTAAWRRDLGSWWAGRADCGDCLPQGLFVQLVQANTPASLVGLHFGDQILQIDGRNCVGWSTGKAHRVVKKASAEKIVMVVRDRTFQRIVTMHKDSTGHVGFAIKKGKVISLVKGSSAARNGLLINHYVCEVNGQNVIGLKDKEVMEILATAGNFINLAIIP
ncbi:hypothetical protein E2I00_001478, partial [Balaenoptera physalus]